MNWLQKRNKKEQIVTTLKRLTQKELNNAVEDLLDRGWSIVDEGTFEVMESSTLTSYHKSSARGMSKSSPHTVVSNAKTRFWCKMKSPSLNESTELAEAL